MITNKIVQLLIVILSIVTIPIQMISTFVLGIFVTISFGLLLIPISLIWIIFFLGPLLALSYIFERISLLRPFASTIGIPFAVLGNIYVSLMPSMGEWDSRFEKMVICQTFPYTWSYVELTKGKDTIETNSVLSKILKSISGAEPLNKYLNSLRADVVSRPNYMKKDYHLDW